MSAPVLVAALRARGFRLRVDGETLWVAPRSRLTEADRRRLGAAAPAVLAVLQAEAAEPAVALALDVFAGATVVRCPRCGGDRWRRDGTNEGERCADCDAWSPMSRPLGPSEED